MMTTERKDYKNTLACDFLIHKLSIDDFLSKIKRKWILCL